VPCSRSDDNGNLDGGVASHRKGLVRNQTNGRISSAGHESAREKIMADIARLKKSAGLRA
jgi:hypothetical protein